MSAIGNLRRLLVHLHRLLVRYSYPVVTSYYRRRSAKDCPASVLKLLGVAHPSYRTDFYTLARIVEQMGTKGGLIVECGVYRGTTLLGMAHMLRAISESSCHLVGFDSFEGFPEPTEEDALADGSFHAHAVKRAFADTSYEELSKRVRAWGFEGQITLVKGYF